MLGTFFLALGGLDPGTAFGGMGSSREMTVAALTEPTLAIAVLTLALTTGSTSLGVIAGSAAEDSRIRRLAPAMRWRSPRSSSR